MIGPRSAIVSRRARPAQFLAASALVLTPFLSCTSLPLRGKSALNSFIFIDLHTLFITTRGACSQRFQPLNVQRSNVPCIFNNFRAAPSRNSFLFKIEIQKTGQSEEYFPSARCYTNCEHEEKADEPSPGPVPPTLLLDLPKRNPRIHLLTKG